MPNVSKANYPLKRPTFSPDWTTLPPLKAYNLDFSIPKEAKNLDDVVKMTGLKKEFLEKIIKVEKLKNDVYLDSEKHPTIGIGHNLDADKHYKLGKHISDEQAYNLFAKDLKSSLEEQKILTGGAKLNTGQKQALLDLSFNVGATKMQGTNLIKKIKAGKIKEAVVELDYVSAGGKVNTGLCKRRMENIYDYAKEQPTMLALRALLTIKSRGEDVFNKKLKVAKSSRKETIKADKANYIIECNRIIERAKAQMHK